MGIIFTSIENTYHQRNHDAEGVLSKAEIEVLEELLSGEYLYEFGKVRRSVDNDRTHLISSVNLPTRVLAGTLEGLESKNIIRTRFTQDCSRIELFVSLQKICNEIKRLRDNVDTLERQIESMGNQNEESI